VAIGFQALNEQTDGDSNTAIGYQAMKVADSGEGSNTAVGYRALVALDNAGGDENTAIGNLAGDSLTTGTDNVFIGSESDGSASGASNQIAIGKSCVGHGNNIAVIGNTDCTAWHPADDNGVDLGSSSYRFANLYVADVQMSNEGTGGNDIDGTEGKWTIQEGEEDLFLLNRKNGKRYKFNLTEV